jgi:Bacterial regulatory proteins, luxR family
MLMLLRTPRTNGTAFSEDAEIKGIGAQLGISHRTVEVHRSLIKAKLGASSSIDLVRIALTQRGKARPGEAGRGGAGQGKARQI